MLGDCALEFQGSWNRYLGLVKFAYDISYETSIHMPPYELNKFCEDNDIRCPMTVSRTPQQNGLVKRNEIVLNSLRHAADEDYAKRILSKSCGLCHLPSKLPHEESEWGDYSTRSLTWR
ncbi:unnamed protein product [Cuscuta epithymum]|uniref:Integrase catalytic domain-containing protein n=1 Tax=Cuscuta epithymum TaxID=186058 RepID=A0AAV0ES72_9ASTE|nr:unnamed protein product [Cuscuta epithymum]